MKKPGIFITQVKSVLGRFAPVLLDFLVRVLVLGLLTGPWIFAFKHNFSFVERANESLAYRYGYAARLIYQNEDLTLPQGQTVLALQKSFLLLKEKVHKNSLRDNLKIFGFGTWGISVLLLVLIVFFTRKIIYLPQFLLAACLPLAMIYGTSNAGAYYYLLPDYYQFNVFMGFLGLIIIGILISREELINPKIALQVGLISGLILANKFTNALFVWPLIMVLGLPMTVYWAVGVVAGLLVPFLILYNFNLPIVFKAFQNICSFSSSQQGEFGFLSDQFLAFFSLYNYVWLLLFCLIIVMSSLIGKNLKAKAQILLYFLPPLFGVLLVLYKRPACTTMWDMMIPVMTVAVGVPLFSKSWKAQCVTAGGCLALIFFLFVQNSPFAAPEQWARSLDVSMKNEQIKWADFETRFKEANGLPVVVFIENNDFCVSGIDEFLLKAACFCPTWEINDSGQRWINTCFPNYYLMHANGSRPAWPKGFNRVSFHWYERPDLPSLAERQPHLFQKVRDSGSVIQKKKYFSGDKIQMEIYSAFINL